VKLINDFEKFLTEEVNLNKTRIQTLTDRVDSIESFMKESAWAGVIQRFSPQGSWDEQAERHLPLRSLQSPGRRVRAYRRRGIYLLAE
jgi:hypothetical protein